VVLGVADMAVVLGLAGVAGFTGLLVVGTGGGAIGGAVVAAATDTDTDALLIGAGSTLEATGSILPGADSETAATDEATIGVAELARELLPMVMTAPTSTPTVMLSADAVSAMPVPRRTPLPSRRSPPPY
jgi:hypothetical protein